ncbi:MAG: type II toxin-antitoxin system RelE/ParE family toxin [Lachnospiraceae bacterium]|nr:type II toxin-antitoxin system RelE/ParE family toxin [Lachnospiraceae bacterium]
MSDGYKVIYSPAAFDDIRNIYLYIAQEIQVPDTAQNQVNRIRKKIRSLDFAPNRYSLVEWEPWKSMQMHKMPVDNYVVYYLVEEQTDTVTVVRIFYSGQDVKSIIRSQ